MGLCGSKEKSEVSGQRKQGGSSKAQSSTGRRGSSDAAGEGTSTSTASIKHGDGTSGVKKTSTSTINTTSNGNTFGGGGATENSMTTNNKTEVKMLLLGSGESGKSTILKQIKIIHQSGFSKRELYDYKPFVFKNISECAEAIIKALRQFDLEQELETLTSQDLDDILSYEVPMDEDSEDLKLEIGDNVKKLIAEPVVNKLLEQHIGSFYIMDSAKYFFSNLDRITAEEYIPDVTDVIRTRKQTSGIYDTRFQLEDIDIHLYDVGGQRSERKKWIHCFDNVTVIMFCVALSEYDQMLLESSTQNRMVESLNLFESVVNSMWFRRTSVILCLNKIDVFIEKLPRSPLEKYFPDYAGGNDVNKAVKYILWRFKQLNRANLNLVPYVTQATDTNNIKLAFAVVKETILHNALMDSGILKA
ncbi:hypothetical protein FOA43_004096 [Brettanomyces nanus]|uniref:Guanine nucleotide-binding protein alpha-2 subunit n=1 Tax=Eeniella nana TaxID=13502 RepID=A0A875SA76_EENNA|nr:uncharacterized protein FOA43_004096 [Brettanomyces nanus]QPG76702.1 hypothetical protein FOA43_004096 [Brettanomyces nanus]